MNNVIYFDNAATTFPKPEGVYDEVIRCMAEYCGNPGRSAHGLSLKAAEKIYECRCQIAELFNSAYPENVVFTMNTTYALNIAIKSMVKKGDHVLISSIEHNSVYRPVAALEIEYDIFNSNGSESDVLEDIRRKIRHNTSAIICTHSSNICPIRNPIRSIGHLCREKRLKFIVDASQSAGIYEIDINVCNIDALCIPSHKGLYGIQGCGAVIFAGRYKGEKCASLPTFAQGGNGVNSLEAEMPSFMPERFEAGTLPTPAIAGLCEGIKIVKKTGLRHIREHEIMLYKTLREMLLNTSGITVYAPEYRYGQIILFNVKGYSSNKIADLLNDEGICVRSGFHCSPLAHKMLNTGDDGAVRVSFGAFNTLYEVDVFYSKLKEIMKTADSQ